MTAMLFTRLQRSATSAMGQGENRAMVIDTTETSAPSSLSLSPHSALSVGEHRHHDLAVDEVEGHQQEGHGEVKNQAWRRGTNQRSSRVGSVPRLLSAAAICMAISPARLFGWKLRFVNPWHGICVAWRGITRAVGGWEASQAEKKSDGGTPLFQPIEMVTT